MTERMSDEEFEAFVDTAAINFAGWRRLVDEARRARAAEQSFQSQANTTEKRVRELEQLLWEAIT